jgi:biotin carboxyl carrier protein
VEAGNELLILEAMKMRNRIVAEISGKIKTIHVEIKQNIPKSHLMIEFE